MFIDPTRHFICMGIWDIRHGAKLCEINLTCHDRIGAGTDATDTFEPGSPSSLVQVGASCLSFSHSQITHLRLEAVKLRRRDCWGGLYNRLERSDRTLELGKEDRVRALCPTKRDMESRSTRKLD